MIASLSKLLLKGPAALLLAFLCLTGCEKAPKDQLVTIAGSTMGTTYSVKWLPVEGADIKDVRPAVDLLLRDVNQSMSTYIPDSELSLFNKAPAGTQIKPSEGLLNVLSLAQEISTSTDGAFDITVGPLVNLWGFGPDGRVISAPSPDKINTLKAQTGYQALSLDMQAGTATKTKKLYLDLSGIAKGFGVDEVARLLESLGVTRYLVEIGGELRASGIKPDGNHWRIAIESPSTMERSVQRIVTVGDTGIATSGDYRNYFEEDGVRYSHTINPATGRPITHKLASVSVLMPNCAEADALATAFTVMGEEKAWAYAQKHNIAAFFIVKSDQGFKEMMTPGFKERLVND